MEQLNIYNMKGYKFTVWFFRILLLMIVTTIILLFVLNINETVSIKEGEIVATSPQFDYKAPYESELVKLYVKEGQTVNAGDTLLVIESEEFATQVASTKAEIIYLEKKIRSIGVLQDALRKKKQAIVNTNNINAKRRQLEINKMKNELVVLDEQYALQNERLASVSENLTADSILLKKDMLSKTEFNSTKDVHLSLKENLANMKSQRQRHIAEQRLTNNNFTKERNNLFLDQVALDENEQTLLQEKNGLESQLIQAKESLKKVEVELNKQNIIASNAGKVNFVFNTRQTSNLINKGDLLISIAPRNIVYYAKAFIPQKDARYVKTGLHARLKLDAYYQFEFGIIKGKVTYMAERKENEKFYALIQLLGGKNFQLKSGYTFRGEIIVQRMTLFRYFIKKIFKKIDE